MRGYLRVMSLSLLCVLAACGGDTNPPDSGGGGGGGGGGGNGTSCEPCAEGYTCQAGVCVAAPAAAQVSVEFPNLFEQSGTKVLATFISHVVTSSRYPLVKLSIKNTGGPSTVQVSVDLPTYGSAATQTVSLAVGETKTLTMSPIIDFARLFQNTTAVPAAINISVTSGSSTLFGQTFPIQITGRNTVFWTQGDKSVVGLIATMVTPQDKGRLIDGVIRGAAERFVGGPGMLGYQSASWPEGGWTLAPGYYSYESFVVLEGESPSVTVTNVAGGVDNNLGVYIMDHANFTACSEGRQATACAVSDAASAGTQLQCSEVPPGSYHIVYLNPDSNFSDRTVKRVRPMLKWEVTYYQSQAIFEELRARGLVYVNLTGTGFFSSAQNVRYPAESLDGQAANCIDGSLLFASAWEALGMEPVLALSIQAGHAFAGVRCWAGDTTCIVPVETTMVGTSSSFADAVQQGLSTWQAWASGGHLQAVDIKSARAIGLTPAPM